MKATDRVSEWLRERPGKQFCDACIASQIGFRGRRSVWRASKVLAASPDFRREKKPCPVCHEKRIVISAI